MEAARQNGVLLRFGASVVAVSQDIRSLWGRVFGLADSQTGLAGRFRPAVQQSEGDRDGGLV